MEMPRDSCCKSIPTGANRVLELPVYRDCMCISAGRVLVLHLYWRYAHVGDVDGLAPRPKFDTAQVLVVLLSLLKRTMRTIMMLTMNLLINLWMIILMIVVLVVVVLTMIKKTLKTINMTLKMKSKTLKMIKTTLKMTKTTLVMIKTTIKMIKMTLKRRNRMRTRNKKMKKIKRRNVSTPLSKLRLKRCPASLMQALTRWRHMKPNWPMNRLICTWQNVTHVWALQTGIESSDGRDSSTGLEPVRTYANSRTMAVLGSDVTPIKNLFC